MVKMLPRMLYIQSTTVQSTQLPPSYKHYLCLLKPTFERCTYAKLLFVQHKSNALCLSQELKAQLSTICTRTVILLKSTK